MRKVEYTSEITILILKQAETGKQAPKLPLEMT